jgi:N-acetylmuramoyl-L-alanine amidase
MRLINKIVIHSADTPAGMYFNVDNIRDWHINPKEIKGGKYRYKGVVYNSKDDLPTAVKNEKGNGWSDCGYHYIILLDGTIEKGREDATTGAHVAGHNSSSIGVCYIGGGNGEDTRTTAQKASLVHLISVLRRIHTTAEVFGHRDFKGVTKACPCFDAQDEYGLL